MNNKHTSLSRISSDSKELIPINRNRYSPWGLKPRNLEQIFSLDLLLDDKIKLVSLVGKAGTGKTVMAIAAALQKTMEEQVYSKIIVTRPIIPMGKDIGYLPGNVEEKLGPWMKPIIDNVEFLMGISEEDKKKGRGYQELVDLNILQVEPLTYIRGRTIPNQFIIIDESQNLTNHEIKTIITRVGEGSKIVLTGDPYQIDNDSLDTENNGLIYVVEKFKNHGIHGHVTLTKGERSELATIASDIL